MSFNIKHLLLFVAATSVALVMSQYFQAAMALLSIAIFALIVLPFIPRHKRRFYVYGGVAGVIVCLTFTGIFIELNFESFPSGFPPPRPPDPSEIAFENSAPYAVSIGMILGATIGLMLSGQDATSSPSTHNIDSCVPSNSKNECR